MNEHIAILRDAVERLMVEVNAIDRVIPEMRTMYPNWDLKDSTDFRDIVVVNLSEVIQRLGNI